MLFGEKSKYQILRNGNRDFDPLNWLKSKNKKNFTNPTFKVGLVNFFFFFDLSPFEGSKSRFVEKRLFFSFISGQVTTFEFRSNVARLRPAAFGSLAAFGRPAITPTALPCQ